MKNIIIGLLVLISFAAIGQQTVPAIRSEINTYFPSSNAKTIQAVKLRETFNDVLDYVDTLNKKRFTKSIANIRLINNTNYELVYVTDSGKEVYNAVSSGASTTGRKGGVSQGSTANGTASGTTGSLTLGRRNGDNSEYYPGFVSEVIIWSSALNSTQIQNLENNQIAYFQ